MNHTPGVIQLFSMTGCASCVSAAKLLESKNIPFEVIKIDEDVDAAKFIQREKHRSMPQLYKDGKLFVVGGYQGLVQYFNNEGSRKAKAKFMFDQGICIDVMIDDNPSSWTTSMVPYGTGATWG